MAGYVIPRVLSSKSYECAFMVWDWWPQDLEVQELSLILQFEPRGREFTTSITVSPYLGNANEGGAYNPGEWGINRRTTLDDAMRWVLAVYAVATCENLQEEGATYDRIISEGLNVNSFADRLLRMAPASDAEIWRYIGKRIYWSWCFGLSSTLFDHADNLVLGLPRDRKDDERKLMTGQIERVAQAGEGDYWVRRDEGEYVPTLRLIREWREGRPTMLQGKC